MVRAGFGDEFAAGMGTFAAENWTDTAQGAGLYFAATPIGSTESASLPGDFSRGGNVGIGVFNDIPTITDKLQVFGDIRVGTTGTNGCLKNSTGTALAGTLRVRPPLQERHHAVRPRCSAAHGAAAGALLLARGGISLAAFRRQAVPTA